MGCGYREKANGTTINNNDNINTKSSIRGSLELVGEYSAIAIRKLREETCKHWGYRVGDYKGHKAHIAYYYDDNRKPVAAKLRFADKSFGWIGEPKKASLYGQWLWKDGGKMVVVTEGEIDALSVSQLQSLKWPVVSVPNGAQGASKDVRKALDWLEKFDTVVFAFDMDEPGRAAAKACAELLTPGKAKIADFDLKDANEMLVSGKGEDLIQALWNAKVYRPDGIIAGSEITRESLKAAQAIGYTLPYQLLDEMIGGIREREITLLTAGSGIGKSTLAREVAYHLHQKHKLTVGNIYLEESKEKTAQGYIAIHNNVALGKLRKTPELLSDAQWDASLREVIHERMYFYDHFGSLDSDHLINKIRYMRLSLGCNFVVLDHISIVISGQDSSSDGERKDIDRLMTKLRSLVEQTGVGIIAIVHLRQPEGKPHEEGGRVTLSQLRGSGSLKQLSDNVIALERDQQGEKAHQSIIRVLKCREFGETGEADTIEYNPVTGRLLAVQGNLSSTDFQDTTHNNMKVEF